MYFLDFYHESLVPTRFGYAYDENNDNPTLLPKKKKITHKK